MPEILLVRHGAAGSRDAWAGDDTKRPLTAKGERQAAGLVPLLRPFGVERVLSSPYVRCVQTVEPLGAALGLGVEHEGALGEGQGRAAAKLVRALAGHTVALCTHGDIVPDVLEDLVRRDGIDLGPAPRCQKGSTWVLHVEGDRFTGAEYLPPP